MAVVVMLLRKLLLPSLNGLMTRGEFALPPHPLELLLVLWAGRRCFARPPSTRTLLAALQGEFLTALLAARG